MLKLEVDNFLGITHAELEDESAFSVIVGPNNSGKSSLASAVEYVFTGGSMRFTRSGRQQPHSTGQDADESLARGRPLESCPNQNLRCLPRRNREWLWDCA